MSFVRLALTGGALSLAVACGGSPPAAPAAPQGRQVDSATASSIRATVTFEGDVPKPDMIRIDGDSKCAAANGASEIPSEDLLVGNGKALQNVFVYVKDGLDGYSFAAPKDPVVLDQQKCRYTPRVLGIRTGQTLA